MNRTKAMAKFTLSDLLRRIMSDSGAGDPAWKRQTAAAIVMGVGMVPALPDVWRWIESFVHLH